MCSCGCCSIYAAAPGRSERRPVPGCGILSRAAHVDPGRSAAAALASSLPALDPHQDAQQRGHRAHALRIRAAAAAPSSFVSELDTGRSKTTLDAQEVEEHRHTVPGCGSSPGGPRWPRAKRSGSLCLFPPRAGSSPGRAAARPPGPGAGRIRAAAAAPSSFVPTVDTGRSKTTLDAQEVNCRLDK